MLGVHKHLLGKMVARREAQVATMMVSGVLRLVLDCILHGVLGVIPALLVTSVISTAQTSHRFNELLLCGVIFFFDSNTV